jgi:hypothetical protein
MDTRNGRQVSALIVAVVFVRLSMAVAWLSG